MEPSTELIDTAARLGRQQAFGIIASKCSAAQAQCLKQVRESSLHERLGLSWEEYCNRYAGISRRTADRIIEQYDEFGENYFRLSQLARISPETYRQIAGDVDDETITIGGEEIALIPENASLIRAGIDRLRHQLREEKHRTTPALSEIRMRLDALVDEFKSRVSISTPTVVRDHLRQLALDAARRWSRLAHNLEKLNGPRQNDES
jgi:hypothetical protein